MERKKKTPFLLLLLHLLQTCRSQNCPKNPAKTNLTCYNDFDRNITCAWLSSSGSDHTGDVCTLRADKLDTRFTSYSSSCELRTLDGSTPALKTCSLIFKYSYNFLTMHELSMNVSCIPGKQGEFMIYKPACHIKVNPPGKPSVNLTSVSWLTQVKEHRRLSLYSSQLEWKHQHQSWSDPSVQKKESTCGRNCEAELDPDNLTLGETYEARVRVKTTEDRDVKGIWSDWSPTESWVSRVGKPKPKPPPETALGLLNTSLVGLAVFGLLLAIVSLRMHKTTWVYMVKKITSPPIPDPAKSSHFQKWLNSNFTGESFQAYSKSEEINSVEVTSRVDAVTFCGPDVKAMPVDYNYDSSGSSFSNPSYSELCSPSSVSSLAAGSLQPCAADAPYGPVRGWVEGEKAEQGGDVAAAKENEIMRLLLSSSKDSEPVKVILDYEKVETLQAERLRLHSVDSGMCSYEEVSQESMEVDSSNTTGGHDEGTLSKQEKKGGDEIIDALKLFGRSGGILGKNSIQVCLDYKQIPKLQAESPELPSLESGVSSQDEHETPEESMEDRNTRFPFPPHPSSVLKCSLLSSSPQPLKVSGLCLSPFIPPLPSTSILEKIPLMSGSMLVEPCGDDYKSVRQEQN